MTREECKKLIMVIAYTFPNFKPQDMSVCVDIWTEMLSEYPYELASAGLKSFIAQDTSGFAPSIGQLIDKIHSLMKKNQPQELNATEAWALAYKAICNSTYHADEEYEKLPPLVKRAVGSPDNLRTWAMSEDFNESVEQSQFIKVYNAECKRAEEDAKLPQSIRDLIGGVDNGVIGIADTRDN